MARGNTITLRMMRGEAQTGNLYQYDYGQRLIIAGVTLPPAYEVHFSNEERGESKTVIGDETGVDIPDEYLLSGKDIHVWLYLHDGEDDGETERHGIIRVIRRAKPTDEEPTPEQQDVITQTIAALNSGVEKAEAAQQEWENMTAEAETLPEGSSATAAYADGVLRLGIPTGATGATGAKGDKGDTGADGYSPTVSTTNLDAQTLVTVTDNSGAHNFYVKDGSSVTNAAVDENGDLIISIQQKPTSSVHPTIYTLGVNTGHVVGAKGAKGDKGDKGDTGNDYVLTAQDKADIANIVLQELPTTQGVQYGN